MMDPDATEIVKEPEHEFFNDGFHFASSAGKNGTFTLFNRLPKELRLKIWRHSLPYQRFVDIGVTEPGSYEGCRDDSAKPEYYSKRNGLGNVVSGYPYTLEFPRRCCWPITLLLVNHEANAAFCEFFRVHIPVRPGGILHLNPDSDILNVRTAKVLGALLTRIEALIAFLHDMLAYDPRGIGIAHLGLGSEINDMSRLVGLDSTTLTPTVVTSFTKLLSSLRTFYVVRSPGSDGRNMIGMLSFPKAKIHQNRSLPVAAQSLGAVEMLDRDPRPIEDDLSHVATGLDPVYTVFMWKKLEAKFDVRREERPVDIRVALAQWPSWRDGIDRQARLASFLQESDKRWAEWMGKIKLPLRGQRLSQEAYEKRQRDLRQVAGIWIFPAEAFGPVPALEDPENMKMEKWELKPVKDLSQFRPALVVFDLT